MVAQEVDDKHPSSKLGRREQVDIVQGKRGLLKGAEGHQAHAFAVMYADPGGGKQFRKAFRGRLQALERAGEKVQGILAHGDDGGVFPRLLQGDARYHTGKAAAHYDGIEFHRPRTCL